jgi:hypothetical protein
MLESLKVKAKGTAQWVKENPAKAAAIGVGTVVGTGVFAMVASISIPVGGLVGIVYGVGSGGLAAGTTATGRAVYNAVQNSTATHQAILQDEQNEPDAKRIKLTKEDEVHTFDEVHNTEMPNVGENDMDVASDEPVATPVMLFTPAAAPLVTISIEESKRISDEARAKEALESAEYNAQNPQNERKRKRNTDRTDVDLNNIIERTPRATALKAKRRLGKKD